MAAGDQTLRSMFSTYNHNNLAFNDIRNVLPHFKDLRTQKKPYTYGNGQTKNLVCLEGTVPITYKTKLYNIPIIVWLHETHPYHAPLVYVQPTATMNIKSGPHVERNGAVNIPYLKDWQQGKSDLPTLVSVLCMVFGESPPVFAKPKNQPPAVPPQPTAHPPPYPVSGGMPQPAPPYPGTAAPGGYTAPPPYPPPTTAGYPSSTTSTATPQGYNPYGQPAQPPYPTAGAATTASSLGGYSGMGSTYGTGNPPYPTANNSTPYPAQPVGGYPPPPTTTASTTPYPSATGYSAYPTPNYTNPATASDRAAPERQKSFGLSDEEIKESLRSAIKDKMRRRLQDIFATHKAEMDVLRNTQKDLTAGKAKLESMASAIDTETTECQTACSILSTAIPELKEQIEKRESQSELSPEDAIETTAPIYRQLLQSYSEEQAIDDALYILGDALRRETIGIDLYLKKVRDLSRKQFMIKALIMKCREKAGLSEI